MFSETAITQVVAPRDGEKTIAVSQTPTVEKNQNKSELTSQELQVPRCASCGIPLLEGSMSRCKYCGAELNYVFQINKLKPTFHFSSQVMWFEPGVLPGTTGLDLNKLITYLRFVLQQPSVGSKKVGTSWGGVPVIVEKGMTDEAVKERWEQANQALERRKKIGPEWIDMLKEYAQFSQEITALTVPQRLEVAKTVAKEYPLWKAYNTLVLERFMRQPDFWRLHNCVVSYKLHDDAQINTQHEAELMMDLMKSITASLQVELKSAAQLQSAAV